MDAYTTATGSLNPLFGGSAFRTVRAVFVPWFRGLNPLFGGSAFRTERGGRPFRGRES